MNTQEGKKGKVDIYIIQKSFIIYFPFSVLDLCFIKPNNNIK